MPVKIGLIGCGKWGQNHARVFSQMRCEFVGIADPLRQTKKIADSYGVEYFKDYRKLLSKVDAVSIVTPTDTHYRIVSECLSKDKAVLIEKPFTSNSKEAKKLITLASQKDIVLAVGHLFRFNSAVLWLKHAMKKMGDINYMTMRFIHSHKPPRRDCGVVFNFGTHFFDILNFTIKTKPKKIFCKNINHLSKKREDCAFVLLDYKKFKVFLELSWFHPLKKRDAWIIAANEKIYIYFLKQKVKRYKIKIGLNKTIDRGCVEERIKFKEPLKEELKHFCQCVKQNKEPINNGRSGYETIKMCEAVLMSAVKGKEVKIKL